MFYSFVQCFYCHLWLEFNWKSNSSHTLSQRGNADFTLWSLNWRKECKDVLGGVTWGILKNQANVQLQSPASYFSAWGCTGWFITSWIVVRVSLGLNLCTMSQSVNAVWLQKRFEVSHHVNLMLWSYKRGHFALENFCIIHQENLDHSPACGWKYGGSCLCYFSVF